MTIKSKILKIFKKPYYMLTRAHPGGVDFRPPPLRFFADNAKTAARSAAALGIAVHSSFPHIVSKFWPRVMSGQVSRSR